MKNKRMNKKAFVFTLFIVLSSLIILIIGSISLYAKQAKFNDKIGQGDTDLINVYTQTEKKLYTLDQIARLTAYQALDNIIFKTTSECGKYNEINKWTTNNKDCYPDFIRDYKRIFKHLLEENIKTYNQIPFLESLQLPKNYEIILRIKNDKTEIIGTALEHLSYSKNNIDYKIKPNFKVTTNFNLDRLELVKKDVQNLLQECGGREESNFKRCAGLNLNNKWKIGGECWTDNIKDDIVQLCYTLPEKNLFDPLGDFILRIAVTIPARGTRGACCSQDSVVQEFDCKANNVKGWWAEPGDCKRLSPTQRFLDKKQGKLCCLS